MEDGCVTPQADIGSHKGEVAVCYCVIWFDSNLMAILIRQHDLQGWFPFLLIGPLFIWACAQMLHQRFNANLWKQLSDDLFFFDRTWTQVFQQWFNEVEEEREKINKGNS